MAPSALCIIIFNTGDNFMKIIGKIIKGFFILLLVCILALAALFGFIMIEGNKNKKSTSEWLNARWENTLPVPLPNDLPATYIVGNLGLQGDGNYYAVFDMKDTDTTLLSYFSSEKNTEFESAFTMGLEKLDGTPHWNDILTVEKRPDWTQTYTWAFFWQNSDESENGTDFPVMLEPDKFKEELYMAYFPESGELYIYTFLW